MKMKMKDVTVDVFSSKKNIPRRCELMDESYAESVRNVLMKTVMAGLRRVCTISSAILVKKIVP
jgi:hypothetical protein